MAKSKNNASRRPDDVTVTSRPPPMKLRSPSARRPSTKFNTPPPKPTAGFVPAESPELSSPPSSPVVRQQQHLFVVPDVRPTERSKAILHAMAEEEGPSRRLKKLDAIKTPPLPKKTNQVPVPVATPTRKKKNDCPAVPVRQTPKRKSKKLPDDALPESEPPADVQLKRKTATTAIEKPPPVKRKTTTTSDHNSRPEKQRKTTATSSQPHPAQNSPEDQLNNLPAPANSSPTRRPNPLLPRRSPRSLAKSAGRPNRPPPEPTIPDFAPPPATIIPALPSNPPPPPPATINPVLPSNPPPPPPAPEPTAPEFEPMHSFDNSASDDDDDDDDAEDSL